MRQILCSELIGRDEEKAVLRAALTAARVGQGSAIVMLGEAGVGKSRLTREIEELARSEAVVSLRGRAVEGSIGAYRPIAEAVLSALRATPRAADLGSIPELVPFRSILGRLIPEWRDHGAPPSDDSTLLLAEAVLRFLRVLGADRGCLLILEDLHWADADTLAVADYLVDNVHTEPVLLVETIRSDEPSPALMGAHRLAARRVGRVLELSRLEEDDLAHMARVCLGVDDSSASTDAPQSITAVLASYAEGLPFLIEELLAAWVGSGALARGAEGWEIASELVPVAPLTFTDSVNRRLGALGSETRRLLETAAVLGRHFDWTLLPQTTGLEESAVLERLRAAADAQLIVAEDTHAPRAHDNCSHAAFRFRHALTRAAVLDELLPPERAALSARLLSHVEDAHPSLPGEWCDIAARLAEATGSLDRAARLLLQSGRAALARGALATAESTLDRAGRLNPDGGSLAVEIDDALAEVLSLTGKWERVASVGERLLQALKAASAGPDRVAGVHLRIARAELSAGHWEETAGHLDRARHLVERLDGRDRVQGETGSADTPRVEILAVMDSLAAQLAIARGQLDEARAFARIALERAQRAALPAVACEALEVLGRCARVGDLDAAEAAFERARSIAEQNGLTVCRIRALHELGTLDIFRGGRLDRLLEARDLALSAGALATAAMVDVQIAAYHDQRFDPESTLEAARRSETMARRLRLDLIAALAISFEVQVYAKLGNRTDMEEAIARALALGGNDPTIVAAVWEGRAFASMVDDNWARALGELEMAVGVVDGMAATAPGPYYGFWALLRSANNMDARDAVERVRLAGALINPINRTCVDYAEAIELGRSGRREEATTAVAREDAELDGSEWYRRCARRIVAECAITDGWGDPASWLLEARDFFESNGQLKLASGCRSLLRQMGVAGSRTSRIHAGVPAPFQAMGVTRREMEVLTLLTEGISNKEIGQRLFLSPRTVERHVASLMARTQTHTRAQLAALAASSAARS